MLCHEVQYKYRHLEVKPKTVAEAHGIDTAELPQSLHKQAPTKAAQARGVWFCLDSVTVSACILPLQPRSCFRRKFSWTECWYEHSSWNTFFSGADLVQPGRVLEPSNARAELSIALVSSPSREYLGSGFLMRAPDGRSRDHEAPAQVLVSNSSGPRYTCCQIYRGSRVRDISIR